MIETLEKGQWYIWDDGSEIRIDAVIRGQVYYVAWRSGRYDGLALRMPVSDFMSLIVSCSSLPIMWPKG